MTASGPRRAPALVVLAVVSMLLVLGAAAVAVRNSTTPGTPVAEPTPMPTTTLPSASTPSPGAPPDTLPTVTVPEGPVPELLPVAPEEVSASCEAPPGADADGTPSSYEAVRAVDGVADTAWRCEGDGTGQQLTLQLPAQVTVAAITIVPGFAKTDPGDGTDRYAQGRRLSQVRVSFDGGAGAVLDLDPAPGRRQPQQLGFAPVRTTTVTIEILASVPGSGAGNTGPADLVAISELVLLAQPG